MTKDATESESQGFFNHAVAKRKRRGIGVKPLPMDQIIALPLQALIRGQFLASQESLAFMEQVGLTAEKGGGPLLVNTIRLRFDRSIERLVKDPQTNELKPVFEKQPLDLDIPLISLFPIPFVQVQEAQVNFNLDIIEEKKDDSRKVMGTAAPSTASTLAMIKPSNLPSTMTIHMKIQREPVPEGLARYLDMLSGQISPAAGSEIPAVPLSQIGINSAIVERLSKVGISSTREFITTTSDPSKREELVKNLAISSDEFKKVNDEVRAFVAKKIKA